MSEGRRSVGEVSESSVGVSDHGSAGRKSFKLNTERQLMKKGVVGRCSKANDSFGVRDDAHAPLGDASCVPAFG